MVTDVVHYRPFLGSFYFSLYALSSNTLEPSLVDVVLPSQHRSGKRAPQHNSFVVFLRLVSTDLRLLVDVLYQLLQMEQACMFRDSILLPLLHRLSSQNTNS